MPTRGAKYDRRTDAAPGAARRNVYGGDSEFLKVLKSTVYPKSKRVREQQGGDDPGDQKHMTPVRKKRELGLGKKRTPAFLQQLQELVEEDPTKSPGRTGKSKPSCLPAGSGDSRSVLDPGNHWSSWICLPARLDNRKCNKEDA